MSSTTSSYDAIVIGLGAVGAATVYQLAKAGKRVLGIDRFSPPHTAGSSHGATRITRQAIGEGEIYVPLALRSHEIWRELEAHTGRDLLFTVGCLVMAEDDAHVRMHNKPGFVATTIAAAKRFGIAHEVLDAPAIRRRYRQFLVRDETVGCFEPGAGYLRPEECIRVQIELAESLGATILRNERVMAYTPSTCGGAVVVQTDRFSYSGEQVVVSAGPWVRDLLPSERDYFTITRQVLAWFAPEGAIERFTAPNFPTFIWGFDSSGGTGLYGFPAIDGQLGGVKVAGLTYGAVLDPDERRGEVGEGELSALYESSVRGRIGGLSPRCVKSTTCLYTVTPDSDFVVQRHPQYEQVLLASPCSGHGFKHSAALGEALAQLVSRGRCDQALSPFTLRREIQPRCFE
jgi:sarcosine oxidase